MKFKNKKLDSINLSFPIPNHHNNNGKETDGPIIAIKFIPVEPVPLLEDLIDREGDEKLLAVLEGKKMAIAEYGETEGEEGLPSLTDTSYTYGMKEVLLSVNQAYRHFLSKSKTYARGIELRLKNALSKFNMTDGEFKAWIGNAVDAAVKQKLNEIERSRESSPIPGYKRDKELCEEHIKVKERRLRVIKEGEPSDRLSNPEFYDAPEGYWGAMACMGALDIPINQVVIGYLFPDSYDWQSMVFSFALTVLLMALAHKSGSQLDVSDKKKVSVKNRGQFWPPFVAGTVITLLFMVFRFITPNIGVVGAFSGVLGVAFFLLSVTLAAFRHEHHEYFRTRREVEKLKSKIRDLDEKIRELDRPFKEEEEQIKDSVDVLTDNLMRDGKHSLENEIRDCRVRLGELEDYSERMTARMETTYTRLMMLYVSENVRARRIAKHGTDVELLNRPFPKLKDISQAINMDTPGTDSAVETVLQNLE